MNCSTKLTSVFLGLILLSACGTKKNQEQQEMQFNPIKVEYPITEKADSISDDYFGTKVNDPYRWLETDTAPEVKKWVAAQNETTFGYLSKIPFRDKIKNRLSEIFNYPRYSSPFRVGEYYFFSKNDGLQNQSVIYYQKGLDGTPVVFLDPNKMSDEIGRAHV